MGHDFRLPIGEVQLTTEVILSDFRDSPLVEQLSQVITQYESVLSNETAARNSDFVKTILDSIKEIKEAVAADDKINILSSCNQSCERILGFFNEILTLAESASGTLKNEPVETDIDSLILFLKETYLPGAIRKKVQMVTQVSNDMPHVMVDEPKLKRILMNLLGNSVKFTDKGQITLIAQLEKLKAKQAVLSITVRDTAGGIPQDKIDSIFGSFTQLTETDRSRGGYGLGLSIVKNYLNTINGKIEVKSELGKGSDFIVEVPVEVK